MEHVMNFTHKLRRRILVALCVMSGAAMTISAGGANAAEITTEPLATKGKICVIATSDSCYSTNAWRTN
jgi:hypothetical protein